MLNMGISKVNPEFFGSLWRKHIQYFSLNGTNVKVDFNLFRVYDILVVSELTCILGVK